MNINELIEKHTGLVKYVIYNKGIHVPKHMKKDMRDIYQEGYVLLIKAAKNFDSTKGFEFSTYATNTIYLGLMSFIDRYSVKRYDFEGFSLENEVFKNEDESMSYKDLLEDYEHGFDGIEIEDFIKKSKIEKIQDIINIKINGGTYTEVNKQTGLSTSTISKRLKQFRSELMECN